MSIRVWNAAMDRYDFWVRVSYRPGKEWARGIARKWLEIACRVGNRQTNASVAE